MPEDWNFYLCNVNDVLASVFLDLGLRELVPEKGKPKSTVGMGVPKVATRGWTIGFFRI